MSDPIPITEVLGRADAGVSSNPFRCRGKDARIYYVKLGNSQKSGLVAEWICAHLAASMSLPIAEFSLVSVGSAQSKILPDRFSELGSGIGFGSVAAPTGSQELTDFHRACMSGLPLWSELLVFDAWILNEDRKLGRAGGNPNALWVPNGDPRVTIIDHDSAFDADFSVERFIRDHLARSSAEHWIQDDRRDEWTTRALAARRKLDDLWASLPDEWLFDSYGDPIQGLEKADVESILDRPFDSAEDFWSILTAR